MWQKVFVRHLIRIISDHAPILINLNHSQNQGARERLFRFQGDWLDHPTFLNFVQEKGSCCEGFVQGLEAMATNLQKENVEVFGNIFYQKKGLFARI